MLVRAENVVGFKESIIQRQVAGYARRKGIRSRVIEERKEVLDSARGGRDHAGLGIQARQLRAEPVDLVGCVTRRRMSRVQSIARVTMLRLGPRPEPSDGIVGARRRQP